MKKLLVGLDGSPTAEAVLPYAETVAKATGATIILVRVVPLYAENQPLRDESTHLVPVIARMPSGPPHAANEKERNEHSRAEHYLDSILARLGDHGIAGETVVVPGDASAVLVDEARARNAEMILLATHGRSGLGRLIFGSVAEAVLAKSPVPVFLARSSAARPGVTFGGGSAPLLIALDGTPEAERALPIAQELARALSTGLSLIEIVPSIADVTISEGGWAQDISRDVQIRDEAMASSYLTRIGENIRAAGGTVVCTVRTDAIGAGIVTAATECKASLIVMATHGRTGVTQALVGSVALEVLHRGTLPVLLIGPNPS
jgi:nucleotide-binding universal stress UspA family protein